MGHQAWYRRTTWTERDRDDFETRFKRSRGAGNKAQYLRIQALCLAEVGHHTAAIELLDRMFTEFPDQLQLAWAHSQKADSLAKLGNTEAAILEYRAALQAERDFPNVRTNAWLDFGWFAVENQLTALYTEVMRTLEEFRDESGLRFPALEYRYCVIRSLIADEWGEKNCARDFAKQALVEASVDNSGLRYHPQVGLVGSDRKRFATKLRSLASG